MEIAKLILEYLSVLIYPVLILIISLLFKKELKELLSGKLIAKYKDLTLTIQKQKKEIEVAEDKAEIAVKAIEKVKEMGQLDAPTNAKTIKEYLQSAINILQLNANEYRIIEILQNENDAGMNKQKLIQILTDPRMDMQTFHQDKNGIENTIENLTKKGILVMNKGQIQFTHKLLKETKYR